MKNTTQNSTAPKFRSTVLAEHFSFADGNRIIGDFMGKNYQDPLNYMYDKDWNQLMEVVEKIHIHREVKEVVISMGRTRIWLFHGSFIESPCMPENSNITECWIACVMFVKRFGGFKSFS